MCNQKSEFMYVCMCVHIHVYLYCCVDWWCWLYVYLHSLVIYAFIIDKKYRLNCFPFWFSLTHTFASIIISLATHLHHSLYQPRKYAEKKKVTCDDELKTNIFLAMIRNCWQMEKLKLTQVNKMWDEGGWRWGKSGKKKLKTLI